MSKFSVQIKRIVFLAGITALLSYGALHIFSYVAAQLVPVSLSLMARFGHGTLLLPGMLSAIAVALCLALISRSIVPRAASLVSLVAIMPTIALLLWVVVTYGSGTAWWVELSDVASLILFTYLFTVIGPKRSAKRDS